MTPVCTGGFVGMGGCVGFWIGFGVGVDGFVGVGEGVARGILLTICRTTGVAVGGALLATALLTREKTKIPIKSANTVTQL
ncbi:MAG: hypothetical protein J2P37_13755 [Ktedonobacteraceae bacterium]|nr:hypothetical protein [Ktedonobacteraceae bacterium]MBO0791995.1 hypothetical protein [Ktedonobacteraceae bacterium]